MAIKFGAGFDDGELGRRQYGVDDDWLLFRRVVALFIRGDFDAVDGEKAALFATWAAGDIEPHELAGRGLGRRKFGERR